MNIVCQLINQNLSGSFKFAIGNSQFALVEGASPLNLIIPKQFAEANYITFAMQIYHIRHRRIYHIFRRKIYHCSNLSLSDKLLFIPEAR